MLSLILGIVILIPTGHNQREQILTQLQGDVNLITQSLQSNHRNIPVPVINIQGNLYKNEQPVRPEDVPSNVITPPPLQKPDNSCALPPCIP
jgi:hypothetical protein